MNNNGRLLLSMWTGVRAVRLSGTNLCQKGMPKARGISSSFVTPATIDSATNSEQNSRGQQREIDWSQMRKLDGKYFTPADIEKLKYIQEEFEMAKYLDERMPAHVSEREWLKLLDMDDRIERLKHFQYLWVTETKEKRDHEKKMMRRAAAESDPAGKRSLFENGIFQRFEWGTQRKNLYANSRWAVTTQEPSICVDLSYYHDMNHKQRSLATKHLNYLYVTNLRSRWPCNLTFAEIPSPKNVWWSEYQQSFHFFQLEREFNLALETSSKHITDLYPVEKLTIITPDAKAPLLELDHSRILVLPGVVNTGHMKNAAMAKAKQHGISTRRLPIDRFVRWESGGKSLPANLVFNVLIDVLQHGDWQRAFLEHCPKRKLERRDSAVGTYIMKRNIKHMDWLAREIPG